VSQVTASTQKRQAADTERFEPMMNSGCRLAVVVAEVFATVMSKIKTVAIVLGMTLAVIAGFNLASPQVKHVLSSIASAVWGA
jgi:hypothetical protein